MNPFVLAIDSAFAQSGIALSGDGFWQCETFPSQQTTAHFLPCLQKLLKAGNAQIDDINTLVWNAGPGSFTGLRLASAMIQGLSFRRNMNILPISSAQALLAATSCQWQNLSQQTLIIAIDARAQECYWQSFNRVKGKPEALAALQVMPPSDMIKVLQTADAASLDDCVWIGDGVSRYPLLVQATAHATHLDMPSCESILRALTHLAKAHGQMPITFEKVQEDRAYPLYVRHKIAQTLAEQSTWQARFQIQH